MTLIFFALFIILVIIDYYMLGIIRVLFQVVPLDKNTEGDVLYDQRVAGVTSNIKCKKVFGLEHNFYSGQHCRVVITDSYIYIGKAIFSSQLIIPTNSIVSIEFVCRKIGFDIAKLNLDIDNKECVLSINFFKKQSCEIKHALNKIH